MKKIVYLLLVLVSILFVTSCWLNPDDDQEIQLLQNTNVEDGTVDPSYWSYSDVKCSWSNTIFKSPSHSLKVSCATPDPDNFEYWCQVITDNLPIGSKPILKAYIKTDSLNGEGVSIAIRGDDTTTPEGYAEVFTSTGDSIPIQGTMDWTLFSIQLNEVVPSDIESITVYLILLPNTSGDVYFDDITLTY
ncbi:MAG: hypothetical protein KAR21_09695 [Spirochaetales bacterium]|nr:hypothetical protein [Spirochaetales bacterium]